MRRLNTTAFLLLSNLSALVRAGFLSSFKNVTRGSDFLLQWEPVDGNDHPLAIHAKLLNRTSEYGANSIEMDIATGINGTLFLWQYVPYPLPYLRTAMYEVELRAVKILGEDEPATVLASSPYFIIAPENTNRDGSTSYNESFIMPQTPIDEPDSKINSDAAIIAGLVIPVLVAFAVIGYVLTQRRQRRSLENRKRREALVIE
ncbi:hypothetical protein F5X96DRAFT_337284 [Biscogniauxia mediterranea]|nr:hypothetical protein F5X96DRAFT_337284 [Biscogniauxia mediterranea]